MLQNNSYLFHLEPSYSPLFHPRSDLTFSLSPSFLLSAGKRFEQPIGGACVLTARAVCPTWPCWRNWLSVKLYKSKTEHLKLSSRKASQGLFVHTLMIWNFGNDWFEHNCYIQSCEQESFHRTLCKPAKTYTLPASLGVKSVNRATDQMHLIRWSWVSMSTSIK